MLIRVCRPRSYEHLMIIYYDVLLIDDDSLLGVRHSERFERLKNLITVHPGYAELVERRILDFNKPQAASDLRNMFSKAIQAREEGLVLKPDEPFLDLSGEPRADFTGSPIKFKKEYVGNFGEIGDFAVVGARYDARRAKSLLIPNLEWTHFYLACIHSKASLNRANDNNTLPEYTVVAVVEPDAPHLKIVKSHCLPNPVPFKENRSLKLNMPEGICGGKNPTFVFTRPLIFDVRCFAFEKPGNVGFLTPRFPAVTKVHFDRDVEDTMTFDELQGVAEKAMAERPWEDEDSQELLEWVRKLENADPKGVAVDWVTQTTASEAPTPSPGPRKPERVGCEGEKMMPPPPPPSSEGSGSSQKSATSSVIIVATTPPTSPIDPRPSSPSRSQGGAGDGGRHVAPKGKRKMQSPDGSLGDIYGSSPPAKRRGKSPVSKVSPLRGSQREPLGEISNCNGSQHTNSFRGSFTSHSQVSSEDLLQENRRVPPATEPSSPASFTTARATASAVPSSPAVPPASTAVTEIHNKCPEIIEIPDSEGEDEGKDISRGKQREQRLCKILGSNCWFYNRTVLLSPRVARRKVITERLLPRHGIRDYVADHEAWLPDDPDSRPKDDGATRICFVDMQHAEGRAETMEFLGKIEARPLRLRGGGREYIEVYDWRVLEEAADMEEEGAIGTEDDGEGRRDRWRQWRVGLV